ncbi:NYN domain-containing protein [Muricoccus radiodurans]|uniref:NYN domain-containing protein n=1 Tax=Muricoccus radiodurans TaxID=2231721 RepID=UPI003CF28CF8
MESLRAALFLDFDNLVSGLRDGAGEAVALRFAEAPQDWLDWLSEGGRRFLIRRCYMNPAGYIEHDAGGRSYYSTFRWAFQAAGFEVVDCPRLTRLKNAADLRIALDAMDALQAATRYEEFTLLSSDADFVPLLLRLRAADRRTRLVAHPELGAIVRAAADSVIGVDALAARLGWKAPEGGFAGADTVLDAVRDIVTEAPVHLPQLGALVRGRTGQSLRDSNYGGLGSLEALLEAAGLIRQPGPGGGMVMRGDGRGRSPSDEPEFG